MTTSAQFPGANAVVLWREEVTEDESGQVLHYERIKVLTAAGMDYANVELNLQRGDDDKTLANFAARTVQPDGSIVTFTGKPYSQVLSKHKGITQLQNRATLPAVKIGSILEVMYRTEYTHYAEPPLWSLQDHIPVQQELFIWAPSFYAVDEFHRPLKAISWLPHLPTGVAVEHSPHDVESVLLKKEDFKTLETYIVRAKNLAPLPAEESMPPTSAAGFEVRFSYTLRSGSAEFWSDFGANWSKSVNNFAAITNDLTESVKAITSGAVSEEEKLRRIYSTVQAFENTDYKRTRSSAEQKSIGMVKARHAADILTNKSGTSNELAGLFLAMVRATGMKAYAALVVDRRDTAFEPQWMNGMSLTDEVVVVNIEGADRTFDPGTPHSPFSHLAAQHSAVGGIRQLPKGTAFITTSPSRALDNRTTRKATLQLNETGELTGTLEWIFTSYAAQRWSTKADETDAQELATYAEAQLGEPLPPWLQGEWQHAAQQSGKEDDLFRITLPVHGFIPKTGSRFLLPADVFTARSQPRFVPVTRLSPVAFSFPESMVDLVHVELPTSMLLEAIPEPTYLSRPGVGSVNFFVKKEPTAFSMQRRFVIDSADLPVGAYDDLRNLFQQAQIVASQLVTAATR